MNVMQSHFIGARRGIANFATGTQLLTVGLLWSKLPREGRLYRSLGKSVRIALRRALVLNRAYELEVGEQ